MASPTSSQIMDLNSIMNPVQEDVEGENRTDHRAFFAHDTQYTSRPLPMEVGNCYKQPYPTPEHSPINQYISTHRSQHSASPCGPLPPMNTSHIDDYPMRTPTQSPSFTSIYPQARPSSSYTSHLYHTENQHNSHHHNFPQRRHSDQRASPTRSQRSARNARDYHRLRALATSTRSNSLPTSRRPSTTLSHLISTLSLSRTPSPNLHPHTSTSTKKSSASNEAYTIPQVHWIRYTHIEHNLGWKPMIGPFMRQFAGERPDGVTDGGLSSRFYRDNYIPMLDDEGNPVFDTNGKQLDMDMKVRGKSDLHCKDAPWGFVERHPWAAVGYEWVSEAHKAQARKIIKEIEGKDRSCYTKKEKYILAIREYEKKPDNQKKHNAKVMSYAALKQKGFRFMSADEVKSLPLAEPDVDDEMMYTEAAEQKYTY